MSTSTVASATPKQLAYLRKLVAPLSVPEYLASQGLMAPGNPVPELTKSTASRLIGELAPASSGSSRRRYPRRVNWAAGAGFRCNCEDAPCCGCN